jgi:hypothetical protein
MRQYDKNGNIDTPHNRLVQKYLDKGFRKDNFRLFMRMYIAAKSYTPVISTGDVMDTFHNKPEARFQTFSALRRNCLEWFDNHKDAREEWLCCIEEQAHPHVVPDAWYATEKHDGSDWGLITIIEVNDKHKLSEDKLCQYFMWDDTDEYWRVDVREVSTTSPTIEADVYPGMKDAYYKRLGFVI